LVGDHGDLAKREPETLSFTVSEGCKRCFLLIQQEVQQVPQQAKLNVISISFCLVTVAGAWPWASIKMPNNLLHDKNSKYCTQVKNCT